MNLIRVLLLIIISIVSASSYASGSSPYWMELSVVDERNNELRVELTRLPSDYLIFKNFEFIHRDAEFRLCGSISERLILPYLNDASMRYENSATIIDEQPNVIRSFHLEIPIAGYIDDDGSIVEDFDADYRMIFVPMDHSGYNVDVMSFKTSKIVLSLSSKTVRNKS